MKEKIADILKDTNGELLYCEQLISILSICGFTLMEADNIRKAFAKKKIEEIKDWEAHIKDKCGEKLGSELIEIIGKNIGTMTYKVHQI